jgi:hypothetical protein
MKATQAKTMESIPKKKPEPRKSRKDTLIPKGGFTPRILPQGHWEETENRTPALENPGEFLTISIDDGYAEYAHKFQTKGGLSIGEAARRIEKALGTKACKKEIREHPMSTLTTNQWKIVDAMRSQDNDTLHSALHRAQTTANQLNGGPLNPTAWGGILIGIIKKLSST